MESSEFKIMDSELCSIPNWAATYFFSPYKTASSMLAFASRKRSLHFPLVLSEAPGKRARNDPTCYSRDECCARLQKKK